MIHVLLVVVVIALAGCANQRVEADPVAQPTASLSMPASDLDWEPAPPPPAPLPVDSSLEVVDLRNPDPRARQALDACQVLDRGLDNVARMAYLPRADAAPRYVAVGATAPEIVDNASRPAWVIQFIGEWNDQKVGQSWIDATCIVIAGEPAFYATGPIRDLGTGDIVRGYYQANPAPMASLPEVVR